MTNAKPFLKWAGGKTQLLPTILSSLPKKEDIDKLDTYVEPFIGGGSVFFEIRKYRNFKKVVINDFNIEIASSYICIRDDVESLIVNLEKIENEYRKLNTENERTEYFYQTRKVFNYEKENISYDFVNEGLIEHIAKLIFLNKTCFNGLYRQNSKGEFNVPYGKYSNPKICDKTNLRNVSEALQNVEITHGDFEVTNKFIDEKTFVYLDPPYRPLSGTANFNSYAKEAFNDESQSRLADWYTKLSNRGAMLMLSNSDPKNTDQNDNFFDNLYSKFNISRVFACRNINSNGSNRGKITEILVTNYLPGRTELF